jgi:beta-glucanase (GH16 family)
MMMMRHFALVLLFVATATIALKAADAPAVTESRARPSPATQTAATQAPAAAQKPGWQLTFDDEFNAPALDARHWNTNYRGNSSLPANYVLADGILRLRIDRNAPPPRGGDAGRVSGIETRRAPQPFAQQYGWFEIRARCHEGAGVACAFWLSPLDGDFDKLKIDGGTRASANEATEIDIFEQQGNEPHGNNFTVHYGRSIGTEHGSSARHRIFPFSFTSDFHRYALKWNSSAIVWYIDGQEVHRSDKVPHTPFFPRLSLYEHNNPWCGDIDPHDPYPKDFEIDYIRIYSKTASTREANP